jgi:hypothetical protein
MTPLEKLLTLSCESPCFKLHLLDTYNSMFTNTWWYTFFVYHNSFKLVLVFRSRIVVVMGSFLIKQLRVQNIVSLQDINAAIICSRLFFSLSCIPHLCSSFTHYVFMYMNSSSWYNITKQSSHLLITFFCYRMEFWLMSLVCLRFQLRKSVLLCSEFVNIVSSYVLRLKANWMKEPLKHTIHFHLT